MTESGRASGGNVEALVEYLKSLQPPVQRDANSARRLAKAMTVDGVFAALRNPSVAATARIYIDALNVASGITGDRTRLLECGSISFNPASGEGTVDGSPIRLRGNGRQTLEILMMHQGQVVTAYDLIPEAKILDTPIEELRKRVGLRIMRVREDIGDQCIDGSWRYIQAKRGVGWIFRPVIDQ